MAASNLFLVVVAVAFIGLAALINVWFLFPVIVIALGALFAAPLLSRFRGTAVAQPDPPPSGTATTSEASYDPTGETRPGS